MTRRNATLRLGCAHSLGAQRLQSFLGAFYDRAPDIDAEVLHLPSAEQCRRLRELRLDLALLDIAEAEAGVATLPLFPGDPLAVFLPADHPLAQRERVEPDRLLGRTLLTHPRVVDPGLHRWLTSLVAHVGYGFAEVVERGGADPRDLLFAVAEGRGVALAPRSLHAVAGDIAGLLAARPLDPPQSLPDSQLAWRSDPPGRLGGLLEIAHDAVSELRAEG